MEKLLNPERISESVDKNIATLEVTIVLAAVGLGALLLLSAILEGIKASEKSSD